MSRQIPIKSAFSKGKAFIPFITCGDPNLETTQKLVYELEKNGADLIELGIPFSDPTAEGPTIQNANLRALSAGVTVDKIFQMVEKIQVNIPLVFMTYANLVYFYGIEKFAQRCKAVGVSGLILPDVPFEEKEEFNTICNQSGVEFLSLIAPTSADRVGKIAQEAKGFVYCVSSLGVTGMRTEINQNVEKMVALAKEHTETPVAIGFGISTPEQAETMSKFADGVIIGSAIVKIIEAEGENSVESVGKFAKEVKTAISK